MKLLIIGILAFSQLYYSNGCSSSNKCPKNTPCCSQYGFCGSGPSYCGGGCNKFGSFNEKNCKPKPKCKNSVLNLSSRRITNDNKYNGNAEKYDLTNTGNGRTINNILELKLHKGKNNGATVSSSRYMLYGRISAKIKAAKGAGIVSSFILMSDEKDEIDFELMGADIKGPQYNYYSKGKKIYNKGGRYNMKGNNQINDQWHEYTIDWRKDRIDWIIDNEVIYTLHNTHNNQFPNTPSRFQFGIWNGGEGELGTRQWAGGYVDFSNPAVLKNGYVTQVKDIRVQC